jgi:hypothetical protein
MKNKLLLSSALVGSLVAGSTAVNAQAVYGASVNPVAGTTVSGNLFLDWRQVTQKTSASNTANSRNGWGRETQLNIANKGKLSNGMDYAAGFSLEFDAPAGAAYETGVSPTSVSNENIYIDLIAGNTTLTFGIDHIQNSTAEVAPNTGLSLMDSATTAFGTALSSTTQVGPRSKEAMGAGIMQNIPGVGVASFWYVPQGGDTGSTDQGINNTTARNKNYEVGLKGSNPGGINGLSYQYFYSKENRTAGVTAQVADLTAQSYGAAYNFGTIAVGAQRHKTGGLGFAATDVVADTVSATYAVNKDLTLGIAKTKTSKTATVTDETLKTVSVGYNLGPVAVIADYVQANNIANIATDDGKVFGVHLKTNF